MDGTTAVWNRAALTYETVVPYFQPMGERLVARAGLAPGEHVLDVACGTGSSLVPAALAVTATGRAVGIDSAPTMVERANGALAEAGAGTAQALVMDCGELEFADGSFDVVLCGCALPFVGLDRGLPEIVRVLRPGGRFLSSGQVGGGPDWDFLSDLCREFELRPMPELTELPSPENIGAALIKAGLTDLDVTTDRIDVVFPDEDAWWRMGLVSWLSLVSRAARARADTGFQGCRLCQASRHPYGRWHSAGPGVRDRTCRGGPPTELARPWSVDPVSGNCCASGFPPSVR